MDKGSLSIGHLAALAGVNLETVRYYERINLMPKPARTAGGHRAYDREHVRRLSFIKQARDLGFGLEAVRALLTLSEPQNRCCDEVREIAVGHLAEVRAKIDNLRRLERILADSIDRCTGGSTPACAVLDMIEERAAGQCCTAHSD